MGPEAAFVEELRALLLEDFPGRLADIRAAYANLAAAPASEPAQRELLTHAHKLAGVGATVGYPPLSRLGSLWEASLLAYPKLAEPDRRRALSAYAEAVAYLEEFWQKLSANEPISDDHPAFEALSGDAGQERGPRILLIDDDPAAFGAIGRLLGGAGYCVSGCAEPKRAVARAIEEAPSLILLDAKTGYDICRDLRRDSRFAFTPILFVTEKADFAARLRALEAGADDLVAKPFRGDELIALVAARVKRLSSLAALSHEDPLTGALNRRAFEAALERAISQARRRGLPLALCVLDLDRFQELNAAYGHAAGDLALREVVRTLLDGLRASDVIGRVGADEVAVAFLEAEVDGARRALVRLGELFSQKTLSVNGAAFALTFSAGVAGWREPETHEALLRRTQGALRSAKANGRNRIVVSPA
jgi:diguanylate cyclase (GGDEF)-like protein